MRVIKRSRERLEAEGKLVRIEMVAVGDDRPVISTHSVRQALELAEEFSRELHKHTTASGFIKTHLQRRVGSSVLAGFNSAAWMLEEREIEDEEGLNEEGESLYPLTPEAREILVRLRDHLNRQLHSEGDPKFDRVLEVLRSDFEGDTWLDRGILIFLQSPLQRRRGTTSLQRAHRAHPSHHRHFRDNPRFHHRHLGHCHA